MSFCWHFFCEKRRFRVNRNRDGELRVEGPRGRRALVCGAWFRVQGIGLRTIY
jgi:hypothetical protein